MNYLKKVGKLLFIFGFCCIIVLTIPINSTLALQDRWQEVASNDDGKQFLDTESIKYKKGLLIINTKYEEFDFQNQKLKNTNSYILEIDCDKRLFKKQGKEWQSSIGDKLITQTIINSCRY